MLLLAPYGRSAAIIIIYYLPTVYSLQLNLHIESHHGYWHIYIYPFVGKKASQNFKVGDITGCKKKRRRKKKKARKQWKLPCEQSFLACMAFGF